MSTQFLADGAAYDPSTDRWRMLPPAPLSARSMRDGMAWTGREVVPWGGGTSNEAFADGAAYDPATNTWRDLPESPLSGRIGTAQIWTGKEMLIWGGTPGTFNNYLADGAVYVPGSNTWRRIPTSSGRYSSGLWTGREMLVWGGIVPAGGSARTVEIKSVADGRRFVP